MTSRFVTINVSCSAPEINGGIHLSADVDSTLKVKDRDIYYGALHVLWEIKNQYVMKCSVIAMPIISVR